MDGSAKRRSYGEAADAIAALVAGMDDEIAVMASVCSVLHERLPHASWTGFYRVVAPGLLRIGPYQGPLGCLEIPFDSGVCGAAARRGETQLVPDVHAFPGHIACDARARSEIVVPVLAAGGEVAAVLDLDSHQPAAFDEEDRAGLERIAELLRGRVGSAGAAG